MSTKSPVEVFDYNGEGYKPLLIRPGWQFARLNYMQELASKAIKQVECHSATDELFFQFQGGSVLVAAMESDNGFMFEAIRMTPGVTCNIPAGVWHAIAMSPGDVVMIVEKDNTHLDDVKYRELTGLELVTLQAAIGKAQISVTAFDGKNAAVPQVPLY